MSEKLILKELQKRVSQAEAEKQRPVLNFSSFFFEKQFKFFKATKSRFKVAVCSRRAGKTIGIIGDALDLCLTEKGVRVLYITLTRENCIEIIWPDLMKYIEEYKIPCKINQQRLSITFENKSVLNCAGAKDEREIGKFRGRKLRRIYVDEAQNFPLYIKKMIEDDLMPTLRDLRGEMYVTGTPAPTKHGFLYEISTKGNWEAHHWTAFDNPHMHDPTNGKDLEHTLEEERNVKGIDKNDPAYIRETYGIWTDDKNSLVYKFDSSKNVYDILPTDLMYIFGVDIGFNDADAISVLGYSMSENKVYLIEEKITTKQNITSLVEQIVELQEKYDPVKLVMDAGALGKKIQDEIRVRHGVAIEAADKNRKLEYIELLNDDLRTARFKAYKGSRFEEDCYLVQWDYSDPAKPKISNVYHSDICDSTLYAWRCAMHYIKQDKVEVIKPDHVKYGDYLEQKEMEAYEAAKEENQWGVEQDILDSIFDSGFSDDL